MASGETRHAGERQAQTLKHNPGRQMHPGAKVTTSDTTRRGSHKGESHLMTDSRQNKTNVHHQGRDYHPDKSVKHHATGLQNSGRNNPAVKSGDNSGHKSGHKGR